MENDQNSRMIWAYLVHVSFNFWSDREDPDWPHEHCVYRPFLRFDESLWHDILLKMVDIGINTVVLDLGDAVRYSSHPEIAVENAWPVDRLRRELDRIREMGFEPIPKLNFSTAHDVWLGPYARCVSSEEYYQVCRDLIAEVCELFDTPRLFHLGMDEETVQHQRYYAYSVIRQHELWWHDLYILLDSVQQAGVRPWVWSDYVWEHPDAFFKHMPAHILQSNWYYGDDFSDGSKYAAAYRSLEAHGFDQVPTSSNWTSPTSLQATVDYCSQHVAPEQLLGFLQTVWKPTIEACRKQHMQALDLAGKAIQRLN